MTVDAKKLLKELRKKYPNIRGVDAQLMPKKIDHLGIENAEVKCIRIYVTKKVPKSELKPEELIPETLEGVCTDIVEIGVLKALDNKAKFRPLNAGISAMHFSGTACTLDGFFKDKKTGQILMASNNHCFAMENKASIGDQILQPSPFDGGKLGIDNVGKLVKFVEIKFTSFVCPYRDSLHWLYRVLFPAQTNKVDIAFASADVPYEVVATHVGKFKGKREPNVGEQVQKTGRTTEFTDNGTVLSTSFVGDVNYSRGTATFEDCILVSGEKFSQGGDSGSPVFDSGKNYVGALFAGSDTATVVCKVKNIEELADVELVLSPP